LPPPLPSLPLPSLPRCHYYHYHAPANFFAGPNDFQCHPSPPGRLPFKNVLLVFTDPSHLTYLSMVPQVLSRPAAVVVVRVGDEGEEVGGFIGNGSSSWHLW
jgi:hypothetical protein